MQSQKLKRLTYSGKPFYFGCMARPERFERPTAWFVARYSIQLSYGRLGRAALYRFRRHFQRNCLKRSGGDEHRDVRGRPLREHAVERGPFSPHIKEVPSGTSFICGGERGIRTLDGLLAHTPLAGERLRPARPSLQGYNINTKPRTGGVRGGKDTEVMRFGKGTMP